MEKTVKLQRYDRKDYTELVDFPVEIVGRDGVVRRYSFEDSIRLYQRRISFAFARYRDPDLARAEMNHCRSRIDQLRRSYFHRYGWGAGDGSSSVEAHFGELAGEVVAFVGRVIGAEIQRPSIRIEPVGERVTADGASSQVTTWYVQVEEDQRADATRAEATPRGRPDAATSDSVGERRTAELVQRTLAMSAPRVEEPARATRGMLLTFHRFDVPEGDAVRDRFFATLKQLEARGACGGDAEKLLAFHHTEDCGFVLTGRGGDFEAFTKASPDDASPSFDASPWDRVLDAVRKGDYEASLRQCREILRTQPWHRSAYVVGAALATYLGDHLLGEELAEVGSRYFPQDAALRYTLGLCRVRLGRAAEGEEALRGALELAPDLGAARGALATIALRAGQYADGRRVLAERRGVPPEDRRLDSDLGRLELATRWPAWGRAMLWLAVCTGVIAAALLRSPLPLSVAALGLGTDVAARWAFRRQLDAFTSRRRAEEVTYGLRQLQRKIARP